MDKPRWTVCYNIVSEENSKWIGRGHEFFDREEDAKKCYDRQIQKGNCPTKRTFHEKADRPYMGAVHRVGQSPQDQASQYKCGHCGYEGHCYGIPTGHGVTAPFCKQCGKNDKLTLIEQSPQQPSILRDDEGKDLRICAFCKRTLPEDVEVCFQCIGYNHFEPSDERALPCRSCGNLGWGECDYSSIPIDLRNEDGSCKVWGPIKLESSAEENDEDG